MSRTLFVVLAVLALLISVSAQSSLSSSSSSYSAVSSSSPYSSASASTGSSSSALPAANTTAPATASSSSSSGAAASTNGTMAGSSTGSVMPTPSNTTSASNWSSSTGSWYDSSSTGAPAVIPGTPYPTGSYAVSLVIDVPSNVTAEVGAPLVQQDIAYNIAQESGVANGPTVAQIAPFVVITSWNGVALTTTSRRLLQTPSGTSVTFIILGNITTLGASFQNTTSVVTAFQTAASSGSLQAPYSGAQIPAQTITVQTPTSTPNPQSGSASSMASASAALVFAVVASFALLL